jgi:hypothetical protein
LFSVKHTKTVKIYQMITKLCHMYTIQNWLKLFQMNVKYT